MDRSHKLARANLSRIVARFFRSLKETRRARREIGRLDALPCDRLDDMGIARHSEDNQRHSGQYGSPPKAELW